MACQQAAGAAAGPTWSVHLDIWLQGSRLDGLQLLDAMKAQHPELPIVMISGHGKPPVRHRRRPDLLCP
jgi:DNA-binding NtrC family response regulator